MCEIASWAKIAPGFGDLGLCEVSVFSWHASYRNVNEEGLDVAVVVHGRRRMK